MEQPEVDPSEIDFDHEELRVFWEVARYHAKLNAAPSYFGPTTLESVPPPAWAYGDSPGESDAFVSQFLIPFGAAIWSTTTLATLRMEMNETSITMRSNRSPPKSPRLMCRMLARSRTSTL